MVVPDVTAGDNKGGAPAIDDNKDTCQFGKDKSNRDSTIDVFRTCADPGIYILRAIFCMILDISSPLCTRSNVDVQAFILSF